MHIVLRIFATILGTIVLTILGMLWGLPSKDTPEDETAPTDLRLVATLTLIGLLAFAISLLLSWRFIR